MRVAFGPKRHRDAQSFIFFMLAWGTIMLLAGLAIDSGLLYLAKARMSRAVDGAALAAVGNFNRDPVPATNRDEVASIMRNFAVANFTSLQGISTTGSGTTGGTAKTTTGANGQQTTSYFYNFNDGTQDANGAYRRFVQVTLNTGSGGAITSATCNARCPVQTFFIGYATYAINGRQNVKIGGYSGPSSLVDLKVSSSAVATRNPRLIMVVIDRSASMLAQGGGASGLPPAVVQFLDFFDTSSDNIGIVSFGSSARLEMPMTTNFIFAGTNNLTDAYQTNLDENGNPVNQPGVDPEMDPTRPDYDPNYNTTGVRRLKFGGDTAADDGIRLAMEQLMANAGFNDPDVVKYMVIFTDGAWNASRTMFAAPGYTNMVAIPPTSQVAATNFVSDPTIPSYATNGAEFFRVTNGGVITTNYAWYSDVTTNASQLVSGGIVNSNLLLVPTLSPLPYVTNAIDDAPSTDFANTVNNHTNDTWQSADATANEPLGPNNGTTILGGSAVNFTNTGIVGSNPTNSSILYYTHDLDVWLQPGSTAYLYHNGTLSNNGVYVSDYTEPTKHIFLYVASGDYVNLVVPGYIADGVVYDGLDLNYPDNLAYGTANYPRFRDDNYQQQWMWPDDQGATDGASGNYFSASLMRQLMFRNWANLLTGFYIFRPDEPTGPGYEPLITEDNPPGAPRLRYGLGAYYPSAGFYWPYGGDVDVNGYVTNAVGVDVDPTYGLANPVAGGGSDQRHIAYSINMLSTNAAPEWAGELFYKSTSGNGTNTTAGTGNSAASQIMTSSDWQNGAPSFVQALGGISGLMTNEPAHNTNISPNPSVWRPLAFNGSVFGSTSTKPNSDNGSSTGGWVSDGKGHYYKNTMAYSGRPTHYYDFAQSSWEPIPNNHAKNGLFLQIGNWKSEEYCWHARALGVTIYTVGYGTLVTDAEQAFLAQLANSTNTTAGGGSNMPFNSSQPIGQQFYAATPDEISNDFYQVGQAINAALTGGN